MDKENGELPRVVHQMTEELRALKVSLIRQGLSSKAAYNGCVAKLAHAEKTSIARIEENMRLHDQIGKLNTLLKSRNLDDSLALHKTIETLREENERKARLIKGGATVVDENSAHPNRNRQRTKSKAKEFKETPHEAIKRLSPEPEHPVQSDLKELGSHPVRKERRLTGPKPRDTSKLEADLASYDNKTVAKEPDYTRSELEQKESGITEPRKASLHKPLLAPWRQRKPESLPEDTTSSFEYRDTEDKEYDVPKQHEGRVEGLRNRPRSVIEEIHEKIDEDDGPDPPTTSPHNRNESKRDNSAPRIFENANAKKDIPFGNPKDSVIEKRSDIKSDFATPKQPLWLSSPRSESIPHRNQKQNNDDKIPYGEELYQKLAEPSLGFKDRQELQQIMNTDTDTKYTAKPHWLHSEEHMQSPSATLDQSFALQTKYEASTRRGNDSISLISEHKSFANEQNPSFETFRDESRSSLRDNTKAIYDKITDNTKDDFTSLDGLDMPMVKPIWMDAPAASEKTDNASRPPWLSSMATVTATESGLGLGPGPGSISFLKPDESDLEEEFIA
ncbi:hypothetical protein HDU96_004550 [Phlyctochytrium bullatum]|nr:hypothetical protein HDU96_004550 [Phlyctochytrium bullatum]